MKQKLRFILVLLLSIFIATTKIFGQDHLKLDVRVPNLVAVGENFRLIFVANKDIQQFTPPKIEGFDVLAGPEQSSSSMVSIVNGKTTQTQQVTFSYILHPKQEGEFTIGEATATGDGQTTKSKSVTIKVVTQSNNNQSADNSENSPTSKNPTNEVVLLLDLSKNSVYPGEPLTATLKLLMRVSVAGIENVKIPAFNGFFNQEIEIKDNANRQRETYNGLIYESVILKKVLLYPQQQTKTIRIEPFELDAIIQKRRANRDVFDSFFGGNIEQYKVSLKSSPKTVNVKSFPSGAPVSFRGAVGVYKLESSLSQKQIKLNEGLALNIKLSGNGNLKLVNIDKPLFPSDLEVYEPTVKENINITNSGNNGTKTFDYQMIARSPGTFTIPPVEFTYFDLGTGKYKTLQTAEHTVEVLKDPNAPISTTTNIPINNQKEVSALGNDIIFIKTATPEFKLQGKDCFGTFMFYIAYLIIILFFILLGVLFNKYKKQLSDITLQKKIKAKKVAKRRLRKVEKYLDSGETSLFYDEIMRALWGYFSDKFVLPTAELSREKMIDILRQKNVNQEMIDKVTHVIDECEFARFGYGTDSVTKHQVFEETVEVINIFEQLK